MRFFLTIVLFWIVNSSFSQSIFDNYEHQLDHKVLLDLQSLIDPKLNSFSNARTKEIDTDYQLDSVVTYKYLTLNDSSLSRLKLHFSDEYGNDTLVVTSLWDEPNQIWEFYEKVVYGIDPLTNWDFKSLSYKWNSQMNKWVSSRHLWRYRNEYGQVDSLISFQHDDTGNISYAYKILYETADNGLHRIGTQINLDVTTGIWNFYNRIETFLNDEGNIDLEITENWDENINDFTYYRKLEYDWDSAGFNLVMLEKRWDKSTSAWFENSLNLQIVTDENGSTERTTLRWDYDLALWGNSRKVTTTLNDIGRLLVFKGDNWNVSKNDWEPLFQATWEYDNETGNRSRLIDRQIWDTNTNNWMVINSEEYEYYIDRDYSHVSKYEWDFTTTSFLLNERDFYTYYDKDIIVDVPGKIKNIVGSDTICMNSEEVVFKTYRHTDIKSFDWTIIPEEVGIFESTDSIMTLTLNLDYKGSLGIAVAGKNGFGIGEYSDTLDVFILTPPNIPPLPEGPLELNQFSGIVNYSIEEQIITDSYVWKLEPSIGGVLENHENVTNFELADKFEGSLTISVQLENQCGTSLDSDPITINARFITGLDLEKENMDVKIYPNPGGDYISISFPQNRFVKSIRILELNGKEIWRNELSLSFVEREFKPAIEQGIYTVLIETDNDVFTKKLIIR